MSDDDRDTDVLATVNACLPSTAPPRTSTLIARHAISARTQAAIDAAIIDALQYRVWLERQPSGDPAA